MKNNTFSVALIIADVEEFKPVRDYLVTAGATSKLVLGRQILTLSQTVGNRTVTLLTIYAGIGKSNAAVAATLAVMEGVDAVVSTGFSGGFVPLNGAVAVTGTNHYEHDFDMIGLGYEPGQKPGQAHWNYPGDETLINACEARFGKLLRGTLVTGDCFVSSEERKQFCLDNFNAIACDMETAVEAGICFDAGIRFLSLRFVSDDASSDEAIESYRDTNTSSATTRFVEVAKWLLSLSEADDVWAKL